MNWTHESVTINDIRKLKQLYAISIIDEEVEGSILINSDIFDERIKSYFLKDISQISRTDIIGVKWNMYLTKGYYVKTHPVDGLMEFDQNPDKWYVSFLDIAGPLGSFDNIAHSKG